MIDISIDGPIVPYGFLNDRLMIIGRRVFKNHILVSVHNNLTKIQSVILPLTNAVENPSVMHLNFISNIQNNFA